MNKASFPTLIKAEPDAVQVGYTVESKHNGFEPTHKILPTSINGILTPIAEQVVGSHCRDYTGVDKLYGTAE